MELEAINRPSLAVWTEQLRQAVAPPPVTATVRVMRPEPQGNWLENLLGLNKPTPQNIPIQPNPVLLKSTPQNIPNPVSLKSAKGIDYGELEKLLKNKQWYEADQLTRKLMFKASGSEEERWIDLDSIKNFPCEDLQTIDRLWVHYSNGLYGFSVQKQIYVECGGKLDFSYPSNETWEKFCDRTAWKSEGKWVNYPDQFFNNNFMYVKGHLPSTSCIGLREFVCYFFFYRIATCEV
jgi:hypothetical protein